MINFIELGLQGFGGMASVDDPGAGELRRKSLIIIVPIMDMDNVARGSGGKSELPHDQNRDWSDALHFPAVAAAQETIRELNARKRFHLCLDLYNCGPTDGVHFHISPQDAVSGPRWANTNRFLSQAGNKICGPLKFEGDIRQTGANYDKANWTTIGFNWVSMNTEDHVIDPCFEIPWNMSSGDIAGYQTIGMQIGRMIEHYFRKSPEQL